MVDKGTEGTYMKRILMAFFCLVTALVVSQPCLAQQRLYVADVSVVGGKNKDEMKSVIQTLLASRLNSGQIVSVGSAAEADALVTGTYITIGKIFSLDAVAKTSAGKIIARSFVQGEGEDTLIPAVGNLADKLIAELQKTNHGSSVTGVVIAPTMATAAPHSDIIIAPPQVQSAVSGDFIKSEPVTTASGSWQSQRLEAVANLLAIGSTLPSGEREIFMAEDRRVSYYRKGDGLKLVTSIELSPAEKIISLDTVENNGKTELYVTIIRASDLYSQILQVQGNRLVKIAEDLSYYFRAISLAGGAKKLYAQSMGRNDDYYGDVYEAKLNGARVELSKPIKMPRFANIYTFNQFHDKEGNIFTTTYTPDGYLVVYDREQKEMWRSNDKFGGCELYFQREGADARVTGDIHRWIFMNQRIQVTAQNEVLVAKNDGFWVLGNARSYKKGAVYNMVWNGSSLEEKWRTKETQNYMPDYVFDESRNEILLLQAVQRSGISTKGASTLLIKKVQ